MGLSTVHCVGGVGQRMKPLPTLPVSVQLWFHSGMRIWAPFWTLRTLTLNLLTTTIVAPPSNASKWQMGFNSAFNLLKPNNAYIGRTAPQTSRRCILYIYPTYIRTEYFKHAAHSRFFSLQNAVYFITLPCLVPVLFALYIQNVLKFKCKIPVPKG